MSTRPDGTSNEHPSGVAGQSPASPSRGPAASTGRPDASANPYEFSMMLARRRFLARAALFWERLWPALWPPLGVAGVFLIVALSGLLGLLPGWLHLVLLVGFGLGFVWSLFIGFRGWRVPGERDGDRRLEQASGLSHRPLAILADRPAAGGDPMAEALWRAHQARAAAAARTLKVGAPHPGLAARDR
ncbi:DUF4175 family protein, partial [Elioraea rosea]|uniref:DUF4175 family protein n=1 Tax=Elioraea rosea TaxID=2492390 RepID=UPI001EF6D37D